MRQVLVRIFWDAQEALFTVCTVHCQDNGLGRKKGCSEGRRFLFASTYCKLLDPWLSFLHTDTKHCQEAFWEWWKQTNTTHIATYSVRSIQTGIQLQRLERRGKRRPLVSEMSRLSSIPVGNSVLKWHREIAGRLWCGIRVEGNAMYIKMMCIAGAVEALPEQTSFPAFGHTSCHILSQFFSFGHVQCWWQWGPFEHDETVQLLSLPSPTATPHIAWPPPSHISSCTFHCLLWVPVPVPSLAFHSASVHGFLFFLFCLSLFFLFFAVGQGKLIQWSMDLGGRNLCTVWGNFCFLAKCKII